MDIKELIKLLSEDLPNEAIQRTKSIDTKKGYDTDGYSYQYCVDRFNDILSDKWGFDWKIVNHEIGKFRSGAPYHDITVEVSIWIIDNSNCRKCAGGHISINYADALKGAITNGFKKTAAFWGVGRKAYAGMIDDDNKPQTEGHADKATENLDMKKFQELLKNEEIRDYMKIRKEDDDWKMQDAIDYCKKYEFDLNKIIHAIYSEGDTDFEKQRPIDEVS